MIGTSTRGARPRERSGTVSASAITSATANTAADEADVDGERTGPVARLALEVQAATGAVVDDVEPAVEQLALPAARRSARWRPAPASAPWSRAARGASGSQASGSSRSSMPASAGSVRRAVWADPGSHAGRRGQNGHNGLGRRASTRLRVGLDVVHRAGAVDGAAHGHLEHVRGDVLLSVRARVEVVRGDSIGRRAAGERLDQRVEARVLDVVVVLAAGLEVDDEHVGAAALGCTEREVDARRAARSGPRTAMPRRRTPRVAATSGRSGASRSGTS